MYVVALVVAGESRNTSVIVSIPKSVMTLRRLYADTLFVPPLPLLMVVLPLTRLKEVSSADNPPIVRFTVTKTLLDELCGVMLTEKPAISTIDALVVDVVVLRTVCTTCNVRKAPRKLFIAEEVKTSLVNDAGRLVGVAIITNRTTRRQDH